jgi:predicted ATP-dependent protease
VYAGEGGVVDIERQATLGGAIHTKGVLILSGFLGQRYGQHLPLNLTASLTFEQSYDEVEGDSASAAELLALLSALAEIPIDQQKAITGSVNQHGQIQAIGGVNEKIEGFFAVCRQAGLTGEQGGIIPHANQRSLMLEEEVIAAVQEGQFHIWTVKTIDEAIELMTGYRAGERKKDGTFPAGSFNHAVQEQLTRFARVITAGRRKPATPKQTNRARSRTTG